MKNSLIVTGILFLQLVLTTKGALANVKPYLNEVRNAEQIMEYESLCTTRQVLANNFLKSLNHDSKEVVKISKVTIASNSSF